MRVRRIIQQPACQSWGDRAKVRLRTLMSLQSAFSTGLMIAAFAAQSVMVAIFVRRRIIREFTMFFSYMCLQVVRSITLFLLLKTGIYTYRRYFYTYWMLDALDFVLTVAVIFEIYSQVFAHYDALKRLGSIIFRWTLVVLLGVAIIVTAINAGSSGWWFVRAVVSFGLGASIVKGGLLFFLFLFARSFGLNWKHYVFGIALGFALNSSVDLAVWVVRARFGAISTAAVSFVGSAAYTCGVFIWMTYLLAPARRPVVEPVETRELDRWNVALEGLLSRGALG